MTALRICSDMSIYDWTRDEIVAALAKAKKSQRAAPSEATAVQTAMVDLVAAKRWTHFLTLSPLHSIRAKLPSMEEGHAFRRNAEKFFYRMSERVYGRGNFNRPLQHATFFERQSKHGTPTSWHSHSLVFIEPEFSDRFKSETGKQWARLMPGSVRIVDVYDLDGVVRYATKFSTSADELTIFDFD